MSSLGHLGCRTERTDTWNACAPSLYGDGLDAEGDAMELLAELQPAGEPFTGMPTHRSGLRPCTAVPTGCFAVLRLNLTGVEIGKQYELAVWLRDASGAEGGPRRIHESFVRVE